jgi:CRP/FNR family transcriptional regulator, cyclic AMP receptor protein
MRSSSGTVDVRFKSDFLFSRAVATQFGHEKSRMKTEQIADVLSRTRLFSDLKNDALAEIADKAITRRYARGDIIFYQGDPGGSLFIVGEGSVKVFIISPNGDELVLANLHPPDSFGELALVDDGPRSACARAIEATTLIALTQPVFFEIVRAYPNVAHTVMQSLGILLRRVLVQASDLVFLDLPGRVAKLLLTLSEDRGRPVEGFVVLDLEMTQSNLAAMVGGSRPSVNQILKAFEDKGYIELRGREIIIKRPDLLHNRAV